MSALRSQIDDAVAPYVAAADFQGVVGVQRDGEAALVLSYGLASVELEVPHRPTDIFMIGSVSKQFTAVAILLLEQDGALRTNDPVGRHLPTFGHGDEVTIEQLLTHRSGVADIYSLERFGETGGQGGTFDQVIVDLGQMELTHRPGARIRLQQRRVRGAGGGNRTGVGGVLRRVPRASVVRPAGYGE